MADPKEKKEVTVKLKAIEPILHDGERIAPGESFVVNKKQAAAHLKNKSAQKVK